VGPNPADGVDDVAMTSASGPRLGRRQLVRLVAVGALPGLAAACRANVPPGEQRGLALPTWEQHGYREFDTAGALRGMAAVGAEWVQIVPTWYQDSRSASGIGPTEASADDDNVRYAIQLARSQGLKVLLKPHLDVSDGDDRGTIVPRDRDAWFRAYRAFLGRYADLAEDMGVDELSVGTELSALSADRAGWLAVVDDVRGRYSGPLVYSANYFEYENVAFWDAVDLVGVDGYWSLSATPTTQTAALKQAFVPIRDKLAAFSRRTGRRILLTEAGYPSQVGAATEPWNDKQSDRPAPAEQAAAYQALLETFGGQDWFAGVFWWTWAVAHAHPLNPREALDHSVRGKAAEESLRAAWAARPR
jgi:hypothetical protein